MKLKHEAHELLTYSSQGIKGFAKPHPMLLLWQRHARMSEASFHWDRTVNYYQPTVFDRSNLSSKDKLRQYLTDLETKSLHPQNIRQNRKQLQSCTHFALTSVPDTFLHVDPLPPQMPHLSNFLLDPIIRSQPAFTHCPWTHTEVESGLHGVPSTTLAGNKQ